MADNPFAALSLIAAPAILTNASSILIMSTSNRLGRTLDRARQLTAMLEREPGGEDAPEEIYLRELHAAEERILLLVRALRLVYGALGGFASAAFLSLTGAVLVGGGPGLFTLALETIAVLAGFLAVGSLVSGSVLLVRETRIAAEVLHEQAVHIQAKVDHRLQNRS